MSCSARASPRSRLQLKIPITIAGMSFGSLSAHGEGGAGPRRDRDGHLDHDGRWRHDAGGARAFADCWSISILPSRYGMNPDDLRKADAIEVVIGQGAKPGGGGMLLGQKITARVAAMRTLPEGIDQRSACRHPDWTGPDDLEIKIEELREITDWQKPIYVKVGALAALLRHRAGGEGRRRRGGARRHAGRHRRDAGSLHRECRHSDAGGIRPAVQALQDLGMHRKVQLIVSGGIRNGADVAKALALGADAVSIGTAALVALGDNDPVPKPNIEKLGTTAGAYDDWHEGRDPADHDAGSGLDGAAGPGRRRRRLPII